MDCKEFNCIACINGECATDKCRGAIIRLANPKQKKDKAMCKKIYELSIAMFAEDFPEEDDNHEKDIDY